MIIMFLRRIILSCFVLYGYNLIALNFNMVLPFNCINLSIISLLGVPGFVALLLFKILML